VRLAVLKFRVRERRAASRRFDRARARAHLAPTPSSRVVAGDAAERARKLDDSGQQDCTRAHVLAVLALLN